MKQSVRLSPGSEKSLFLNSVNPIEKQLFWTLTLAMISLGRSLYDFLPPFYSKCSGCSACARSYFDGLCRWGHFLHPIIHYLHPSPMRHYCYSQFDQTVVAMIPFSSGVDQDRPILVSRPDPDPSGSRQQPSFPGFPQDHSFLPDSPIPQFQFSLFLSTRKLKWISQCDTVRSGFWFGLLFIFPSM